MPLPVTAYSNLSLVRPTPKRTAATVKASANAERNAEDRLRRKIEQANRVLDRLAAREKLLAGRIKTLQGRRAVNYRRTERIEDRILTEMIEAGLKSCSGLRCSMTARPAPAALVVDDESLIPSEYKPEKTVVSVDKMAIKAALARDGELVIEGCHLEQKVSLIRK